MLGLILSVAIFAFAFKLSMWALWPGYILWGKMELYLDQGGEENVKPFWPMYWRMIRGVAEPSDPAEIVRSDDGGLILMAVIALPVAIGTAYRFRKYLILYV